MFGKILVVILVILMMLLGYIIYYNTPTKPVSLSEKYSPKTVGQIDYEDTPVFWENLRFASSEISYFIEPGCPTVRKNGMLDAFAIFQREVGVIRFFESDYQNADIIVACSQDFVDLGDNMFAAGEGGPDKVLNSTNFKIIQSGKIVLFRKSDCDYPVVELHELLHVFGFDHSTNPNNIMFNISDCAQRMTSDIIEVLRELYSIPSLPDLTISKIDAKKKGRYLDFEVTISNEGLNEARDVYLDLVIEGESFERIEIGDLQIGYGRTITAQNIAMPKRDPEKIYFIVDKENKVEEINEENNEVTLTSQQ